HRIHCVVVKMGYGSPRLVTDAELAGAIYDGRLDTATAEELSRSVPVLRRGDTLGVSLERVHEDRTTHAAVVRSGSRRLGVVSVLDLVEHTLRTADDKAALRLP